VVTIANHHPADMTVYLLAGVERWRLGSVASHGTTAFDVPRHAWGMPHRLVLLASNASEVIVTDEFVPEPGLSTFTWRGGSMVAADPRQYGVEPRSPRP
jgi:hypothetical protein